MPTYKGNCHNTNFKSAADCPFDHSGLLGSRWGGGMLARRVGRWKNDELFVEEGGEAWGGAGLPGRDEGLDGSGG